MRSGGEIRQRGEGVRSGGEGRGGRCHSTYCLVRLWVHGRIAIEDTEGAQG